MNSLYRIISEVTYSMFAWVSLIFFSISLVLLLLAFLIKTQGAFFKKILTWNMGFYSVFIIISTVLIFIGEDKNTEISHISNYLTRYKTTSFFLAVISIQLTIWLFYRRVISSVYEVKLILATFLISLIGWFEFGYAGVKINAFRQQQTTITLANYTEKNTLTGILPDNINIDEIKYSLNCPTACPDHNQCINENRN